MNIQVGKLINAYGVELGKVTQIELGNYSVYEWSFLFVPLCLTVLSRLVNTQVYMVLKQY